MHQVSLGKDDSKCKTQALQKISMTAEALYASWWVPLFQNYLHFGKTFTYKFSQSLQLLFLHSHRPLKIHRHLVIDLFGSRADLQIDHPVTKPQLILNQQRCLRWRRRWAVDWPNPPWLHSYLSSLFHHTTNKQSEDGKDSVSVVLTHDCAQKCARVEFYWSAAEQYSQKQGFLRFIELILKWINTVLPAFRSIQAVAFVCFTWHLEDDICLLGCFGNHFLSLASGHQWTDVVSSMEEYCLLLKKPSAWPACLLPVLLKA